MKVNLFLILSFIIFCTFSTKAQTGENKNKNLSVSASLHDSTRNIVLEAASVAIYKKGEDKLHSVTLSNKNGKFVLDNIPFHTSFRLRVINMGYELFEQDISTRDSSINLGMLYLTPTANELEEIKVLAPVRMVGDTIVFNADAFLLDSNAVAGDLLAKLPGIIIWGDNDITYNGKKIKSLYVNGKEFFSTNMNIALQNLPKNIIDKVQIFDTYTSIKDNQASKDINIILKKGKNQGLFGKLSIGVGNSKQKELEAIANLFNSSTQLSLGSVQNNINKSLDNVDQLLNSTTFGGISLNTNYFPDLKKKGYNEDTAYGLLLKHNFSNEKLSAMMENQNNLTIDVFNKTSNLFSERNSNTIYLTSQESKNSTATEENQVSKTNNFLSNINYKFKKNNRIDLSFLAKFERLQGTNNKNTSSINKISDIESRENTLSAGDINRNILNLNTHLQVFNKAKFDQVKWNESLTFKHNFLFNPSSSKEQIEKNISSTSTDLGDRLFSRNVLKNENTVDQDLMFKIEKIFPRKLKGLVNIDLAHTLRSFHKNSDNIVRDSLKINESLTFDEKQTKLFSTSSLSLGRKLILDKLYMRYEKSIGLYSNFDLQVIKDDIQSGYMGRNLNRINTFILPSIEIKYGKLNESNFLESLSLLWNISYDIPPIELIAPVVDNINILHQTFGNRGLQNKKDNNIGLNYSFSSFKPTGLKYELGLNMKVSENAFVTNVTYKDYGRREIYFINDQNTQVSYTSTATFRKAFEVSSKNNFSVVFSNTGVLSKQGQVINSEYDKLKNLIYNGNLNLTFNFSNLIKLGIYQNLIYSQQKNLLNINFKNIISDSNLSLGIALRKNFFFNTNMSYLKVENSYNSGGVLLWNFSASYRALKKNNLEIKVSALDILNNNSSINTNSSTTYTLYENNNILRRYVMLNLSYYPRFF